MDGDEAINQELKAEKARTSEIEDRSDVRNGGLLDICACVTKGSLDIFG